MATFRGRLAASLRRPKPAAPEPASSEPTPDEEALLPRWLRPSVRAARVASLKNPTPTERRAPVLFTDPVDDAGERLVVRYDRVQLLDRPDDALGMPLGELDTGDEVEVLERDSTRIWARVRTPGERDGWVPAMTLTAGDAFAVEAEAEPVAEGPDAAIGESDLPALEDLLAIAAQRRALADAQPPAAPKRPRKPPTKATPKRSDQSRKSKKPNHRTSARKKRR